MEDIAINNVGWNEPLKNGALDYWMMWWHDGTN